MDCSLKTRVDGASAAHGIQFLDILRIYSLDCFALIWIPFVLSLNYLSGPGETGGRVF